jgi:hypothetical protein
LAARYRKIAISTEGFKNKGFKMEVNLKEDSDPLFQKSTSREGENSSRQSSLPNTAETTSMKRRNSKQ